MESRPLRDTDFKQKQKAKKSKEKKDKEKEDRKGKVYNPFEAKNDNTKPLRIFFLKHISVPDKPRARAITDGEKIEEEKQPWMYPAPPTSLTGFKIFPLGARFTFRVFDTFSRADFYEKSGNIAAGCYRIRIKGHKPLQTRKERNDLLGKHADYGSKTLTPFISADASVWATLQRARKKHEMGRGPIRLAMIDNAVRKKLGYPFFQMKEELLYYAAEDPYGRGYEFYETEILYPYIITPEEIVAVWEWDDLGRVIGLSPRQGDRVRFSDELVGPALKEKYGKNFLLSLDPSTGAVVAEESPETSEKNATEGDNFDSAVGLTK